MRTDWEKKKKRPERCCQKIENHMQKGKRKLTLETRQGGH
jgi:hypothetical protein